MAELDRERCAAFTYFWRGCQHWMTTQKETVVGLVVLVLVTYAWALTGPIS